MPDQCIIHGKIVKSTDISLTLVSTLTYRHLLRYCIDGSLDSSVPKGQQSQYSLLDNSLRHCKTATHGADGYIYGNQQPRFLHKIHPKKKKKQKRVLKSLL